MDKRLKFLIEWSLAIGLYLTIEWFYNQHLLTLLTYPDINEDQFEATEVFGKLLAAFGINFVIKELFNYKGKFFFFIGVGIAYGLLTIAFNYFLDNAPNDLRYTSYYSTMHRKDVINKKDADKILDVKSNEWFSEPMLLSTFFMTFENNYWKKYETDLQNKAKDKTNSIRLDKEKYYNDYVRAENGRKALEDGWQKYLLANYKYMRYKYTRYEERARSTFISKVGIEPDLTEPQFYKIRGKEYLKYLDTLFFEGSKDSHLESIYGKDIPKYMDRAQFYRYLDSNISNVNIKIAPKIEEIKGNENSRNALAIILIPPISLVLSFLSIVLNIFFLILLWVDYILVKNNLSRVYSIIPASFMIALGTTYYLNTPKITENFSYWNNVEVASSKKHNVLSFFWNFSLKGERLLCFGKAPNDYVVKFTEKIYSKKESLKK